MKGKNGGEGQAKREQQPQQQQQKKPPFRPAKDDTKPLLQDPILISDPTKTEEAVLRLPSFPTSSNAPPDSFPSEF